MKTFAIIGLSTFGHYMAQFLSDRNLDVIVIDSDEDRVERAKQYVTKGIIADATDRVTLQSVGIDEADAVIVSLGESIDASLLVVMHLKEIGVKEIYVKVLTEDHAKIVSILGVTEIIFPEKDSAFTIAQRIDNHNVLDYIPLMDGYSIIDLTVPQTFIGKSLAELDLRNLCGTQIVIIRQSLAQEVVVPKGDYAIKTGDVLVVMGKHEDLERLKKIT